MVCRQVYGMELGRIGGHFSPINSLSFSPDGRSSVSFRVSFLFSSSCVGVGFEL